MVVNDKTTLKKIVIPTVTIKPTTIGLTPLKKASTPLNFNKLLINDTIKSIITKDGKTTPSVAKKAPMNLPNKVLKATSPTVEPTKVAILIAIGPGDKINNFAFV